jgi:hypothetical protein
MCRTRTSALCHCSSLPLLPQDLITHAMVPMAPVLARRTAKPPACRATPPGAVPFPSCYVVYNVISNSTNR